MTLYYYRHNGSERKRICYYDQDMFRVIGSLHTTYIGGNRFSNFRVMDADNDTALLQEC